MIRKTDISQDVEAVKAAVKGVEALLHEQGQVMVTSRPGSADPLADDIGWMPSSVKETEFTELNEVFRGTAIEELLGKLSFPYGRVRVMLMRPKTCLSIHADRSFRYHFAVHTTPDCFLLEMNGDMGKFHHIPADGWLYEMDGSKLHSAMNSGRTQRIHLVISSAVEARPENALSIGRRTGLAKAEQ